MTERQVIERSAEISDCGQYRWWLKRKWTWSTDPKSVCFVMLNPSTADAERDDPTVLKCISFAKKLGGSELVVRNLYPYRTSSPQILGTMRYPTGGPRGNKELVAAAESDVIICAWGNHAQWVRADWFAERMEERGKVLYCLGKNSNGSPRHPLYTPLDEELAEWRSPGR